MKPGTAPRRDHEEFEGRLEAHRGIVFKLANAYCPAGEERDDLVQEICLQLWRSYPGYDRERRFSPWMFRVALNTAISFARAARARDRRYREIAEILGISETNVGTRLNRCKEKLRQELAPDFRETEHGTR